MHVITGQIRKDVYTKEGSSAKGAWKMYGVEMSESWKDFKTGERQYSNYRVTLFASSPAAQQYYDEVLVKGSIVSFSAEKLQVNQREHNGTNYITLEMVNAKLDFANAEESSNGQSSAPRQQQGQHQQQRQQSSNQQANSAPPADFDDDIPFAYYGLQYATHAIHSL